MTSPRVVRVNGVERELRARPETTLLSALRDQLGLTGAKEGCGRGECGSCTVLIDETPVLSCLVLASRVEGDVLTVEGLAERDADLLQAFAEYGGFQCGFCTPGQVMSASALLRAVPSPTPVQVRHVMSGNICRCTGYQGIVAAVQATVHNRATKKEAP